MDKGVSFGLEVSVVHNLVGAHIVQIDGYDFQASHHLRVLSLYLSQKSYHLDMVLACSLSI